MSDDPLAAAKLKAETAYNAAADYFDGTASRRRRRSASSSTTVAPRA